MTRGSMSQLQEEVDVEIEKEDDTKLFEESAKQTPVFIIEKDHDKEMKMKILSSQSLSFKEMKEEVEE